MTNPIDRLSEVARDEWADPVVAARRIAADLQQLIGPDWAQAGIEAAREIRSHRAGSPLILAITEAALDEDPGRAAAALARVTEELEDDSWAMDLGQRAARHATLGVTSLGANTRSVLEAGLRYGAEWETLLCRERAIARGLGYLRVPIIEAPPEEADVVLVAVVAAFGPRVWTTARLGDLVLRAHLRDTEILPVFHPLAQLSPANRKAFRPDSYLTDVEI